MAEEKWYIGKASRHKVEELLGIAAVDGSFVVRASESVSGAYALSILYKKTVHTYRVLPTADGSLGVQTLNGVQQRKFSNLSDLVREYYRAQNGLVCGLTNPVGLETKKSPRPAHGMPLPPIPNSTLGAVRSHVNAVKVLPTLDKGVISITETGKESRYISIPPVRNAPERPVVKNSTSNTGSTTALHSTALHCNKKDDEITVKYVSRLNEIKAVWPTADTTFFEALQHYTTGGGLNSDLLSIQRDGGQCAALRTFLAREAVVLQSELESFLMKTDILWQLFDFTCPPKKTHAYDKMQNTVVDLGSLLARLGSCKNNVQSLTKMARNSFQEQDESNSITNKICRRQLKDNRTSILEKTFEVKQDGAIVNAKQKLKVDILEGKLWLIKADGMIEYDHTQVLQIIKSNKSKNKLSIICEGNKKRDYLFEQSTQREAFCQLMQHVRNKHCTSKDPDNVKIFCGSWNMGDSGPPLDISSWFMCNGSGRCLDSTIQAIPHDIYVVGTQETGLPEKEWMHKVLETIQDITATNFYLVVMDALWHIKIMVLVKEEYRNWISHVQTSSVKTGIANALGNKGAVAVSFQFGGTSFCFINAHLTSGAEKCGRRNQNYQDILRSLNLGEDRFRAFDITNRFDHLYFLGDLNYRLDMDVQEILGFIKKREMGVLYKADQLRKERDSNKVFTGFNEEEILFPPTYRYEKGTRETYSYRKVKKTGIRINVPSWCDRVLWRSYPETHNVCLAYGCSDDVMTSDHSPVFSNFEVGVRGQYVSNKEISTSTNTLIEASINFESIEVIMKDLGKTTFFLQFHSACLSCPIKSSKNNRFETGTNQRDGCVVMVWLKDNLPQLKPIISDHEYLLDQHILVSVRAEEDSEVYAECVVALRSMIGSLMHNFFERLTRKGEEAGSISGRMAVRASDFSQTYKEKTYDFIQRDDEVRTKRQVSSAIYTDIPDVPLPPPISLLPHSPNRSRARRTSPAQPEPRAMSFIGEAIGGGRNAPLVEEGEYEDPDMTSSNLLSAEINNPMIFSSPIHHRRSPGRHPSPASPESFVKGYAVEEAVYGDEEIVTSLEEGDYEDPGVTSSNLLSSSLSVPPAEMNIPVNSTSPKNHPRSPGRRSSSTLPESLAVGCAVEVAEGEGDYEDPSVTSSKLFSASSSFSVPPAEMNIPVNSTSPIHHRRSLERRPSPASPESFVKGYAVEEAVYRDEGNVTSLEEGDYEDPAVTSSNLFPAASPSLISVEPNYSGNSSSHLKYQSSPAENLNDSSEYDSLNFHPKPVDREKPARLSSAFPVCAPRSISYTAVKSHQPPTFLVDDHMPSFPTSWHTDSRINGVDSSNKFDTLEMKTNDVLPATFSSHPPAVRSFSQTSTSLTSRTIVESLYSVPTMRKLQNIDNTAGSAGLSHIPSAESTPTGIRRRGGRSPPATVEQFLSNIRLSQYTASLEDNGWDSVEFLCDLTEEDLYDCGITNPQHCRLIIEKIQALSL